jgi:ABC-2 type transport system permease protein
VKAVVIALTDLRLMLRRRANIFFVFVFPMLLILVLGATFGGAFTPRLGVVAPRAGPLARALIAQLDRTPRLRVKLLADDATLLTMVERGDLTAGLEIPAGYDQAVSAGRSVDLRYLARPGQFSQQLGQTVRGAVAKQATLLGAARFAVSQGAAADLAAGLRRARSLASAVPAVSVTASTAGTAAFSRSVGQFDQGAWTELLLFMFLTALTGSVAVIEIRRLGLPRRMLSTPTTPGTLVAGQVLGRLLIVFVQALVIIVGSALLFGVTWGSPLAVGAVVILFGLVAASAGVLIGTLFRTEQQATGLSLLLGLGFAALGGCMVPLEFFSPTLKRIAHLTPHAWANDAFAKLIGDGSGIGAIWRQLAVLAGYAVVLLAIATWRLRRVIVRA